MQSALVTATAAALAVVAAALAVVAAALATTTTAAIAAAAIAAAAIATTGVAAAYAAAAFATAAFATAAIPTHVPTVAPFAASSLTLAVHPLREYLARQHRHVVQGQLLPFFTLLSSNPLPVRRPGSCSDAHATTGAAARRTLDLRREDSQREDLRHRGRDRARARD